MAIQYPGGTIRNQTLTQTAGTKVELCDWIKAELALAGWTVASGASGDWKLDSGTDAQSKQFRVRVWDGTASPTSTNCMQIRIMNVGETVTPAQSAFLLPAVGKTWRIVANKYQAFVWVPGGSTVAREFAAFGQTYTGMTACSAITTQAWLIQNAANDTDTTADASWRTGMSCATGAFILNSASATGFSGTASGVPKLMPIGQDANGNSSCYRWHNDDYFLGDAILFTGTTGMNEEGKARGQLWGAMVDSADRAMDTTFAFDSHNWIVITASNTNANGRGTLCVATD